MIPDPLTQGLNSGWQARNAAHLDADLSLETDVVIVGTGAGGGIAAEVLTQAGLDVIMIEEGPLKSSSDFRMKEREAYPDLYQEQASRKTKDKSITVLQGRCVGGGTTINWTSSFRTPANTLKHWAGAHEVAGCSPEEMEPWFAKVTERLNISPWTAPPNPNNAVLKTACEKLGWSHQVMSRNVKGCANLGYCGLGCPINAKQSMLVTTIPAALEKGARLFHRARARRLTHEKGRITGLICDALDDRGIHTTGKRLTIRARHYVTAAGAIGSPALLLRSDIPDPHSLIGKRTFLHPVQSAMGIFKDRIDPWSGAPQSIYSDQFLWHDGITGAMGYKLEVPPLHPLITSTVIGGHGPFHAQLMEQMAHMQCILTLGRDGFHPQSQGGRVTLRPDGYPMLDYPFTKYMMDGLKRAQLSIAELEFAAGAKQVFVGHRDANSPLVSWNEAKKTIESLSMEPLRARVFSAHVMGGCPAGENPRTAVVDSNGLSHHLENLSIIDGSIFPTSIGTNPQVSIYGTALKNTTRLAQQLTGKG